MKKIFCLLLLVSSITGYAQSIIDQLDSDTAVIDFVKRYSDQHQLRLGPVDFEQRELYARPKTSKEDLLLMDSLLRVKWIIHDFNNDGKKDLIFNGRVGNSQAAIIAFITGGDTLSHTLLGERYGNYTPQSIALYGNQYLLIGQIPNTHWEKSWSQRLRHDTLTYRFGGFIEHRPATKTVKFDSLFYAPRSNWLSSSNKYIMVRKNGLVRYQQAVYRVDSSGPKKISTRIGEFFSKKMSRKQINELRALVAWMGVSELKNNYELPNVFDLTTASTIFYLQNKTVKKIEDYGMCGTYGLRLLYSKLYKWTLEDGWRLERSEDNPTWF